MNFQHFKVQTAGVGALVFMMLLVIYWLTLAPTFLHIDCGELAAAQYSLGISHPTGYPLFSILGYLFLKLPLFARPIIQSNFLSAIWTAAGVAILSSGLCSFLNSGSQSNTGKESASGLSPFLISLATGLIFGSTLTVWAQATSIEVYSLHLLLLSLILWFLYLAWQRNGIKDWVILAIFLGLGFSNHLTTLMVMPTVAFLYFHKNGINQKAFQNLLFPALAGLAIIGLGYGFLFWRASSHPTLSWGNIHDWTTLKRHLTGHQYQNWIFAGSKVAAKNLGKFLKAMPKEWAIFGPVLMIIGIRKAFQFNRIWAWSLIIGLIFNIFYVSQYDIKDLEPYFMLTMVVMAYLMAFGLKTMVERLAKPAYGFGVILFPILAISMNWKASDQSKTRFFETYSQAVLKSVEPNALILSQQWDFLITPYYYLKVVENQFSGVLMVDKELMRRSWYINGQLPILAPDIFSGADAEKAQFLNELAPFEENKPYNGQLIEEAFQGLIGKILTEQHKKRPVYLTLEYLQNQELRIPRGYTLIPMGLVARLEKADYPYVPLAKPAFEVEFPENWTAKGPNQYYSQFVRQMWNFGCELRSRYESQFGKNAEAQTWAQSRFP